MSAGEAGLMAEFREAGPMLDALRAARAAGWRALDAFAPHPVPEAAEAMGVRAAPVAWIAVAAGLAGAAITYAAQWWIQVQDYPVNVGGRPLHAWPVFLPSAYIVGVLWACLAALAGMLWLNGLPRLHHPVFGARGFHRASEDRYFLFLDARDPLYDRARAEAMLRAHAPARVSAVPAE
ncbi:DUF3341 domain-containing protein [Craurococcus roseus]|uniref:DUF3341 domain-containing protein n=1 Tax=Craurococcus roseus TaxID=77585 RepID=A0ABP3PZ58_9PROT